MELLKITESDITAAHEVAAEMIEEGITTMHIFNLLNSEYDGEVISSNEIEKMRARL